MQKQGCDLCQKKLSSVFASSHVCKRCTRNVCKECADRKTPIYTSSGNKKEEHRACDSCWRQIQKLETYVEEYKMKFNTYSLVGESWSNLIPKSFEVSIEGKKNKAISVSLKDLWKFLSYELRTLLGLVTSHHKSSSQYIEILEQGFQLLMQDLQASHFPYFSASNPIAILLLYFTCHCPVNEAVRLSKYCLNIGKTVNTENIYQVILQLSNDEGVEFEVKRLKTFCIKNCALYILSMGLQYSKIDLVHAIINETLIQKSCEPLENFMGELIWKNRNLVLQGLDSATLKTSIFVQTNWVRMIQDIKVFSAKKSKLTLQKYTTETKDLETNDLKTKALKEVDKHEESTQSELPKPIKVEQEVIEKLTAMEALIQKIETEELNEQQLEAIGLQDIDSYLDHIIQKNDEELEHCGELENYLVDIEQQLFKFTKPT